MRREWLNLKFSTAYAASYSLAYAALALFVVNLLGLALVTLRAVFVGLLRATSPHHRRRPLVDQRVQSSSLSRRTASLCGFFDFNHTFDGPLRYGASIHFETMPSSPIIHACWNTDSPSSGK